MTDNRLIAWGVGIGLTVGIAVGLVMLRLGTNSLQQVQHY